MFKLVDRTGGPIVAFLIGCTVMLPHAAFTQTLPKPSRTIFKCVDNGKTFYSDSPCLGASKVDIEPSRGVSKLSGKERVGPDVRYEQHRETMSDALRPLSGMDAKQYAVFSRRVNLPASSQQECRQLDTAIAAAEGNERDAVEPGRTQVRSQLLKLRQRFREVSC